MAAEYRIEHRRPRHTCNLCPNPAPWAGVVAGTFVTGRACDGHKADLTEITREMARDWQPCPCPDPCGH